MQNHFGHRLKMLHCCTDQAMTNALAEMELTCAQGHILVYLSHRQDAPCPKDIEEVFHLSHPTVSGLLSRLEKKEFIAIKPDENDKRCKRIHLLSKGEACHQRMHEVIQETETRLIQGFTAEEAETFARLLDRATQNMGGKLRHPWQKEEKTT